ncbi:hypothetical protein WJX72_010352 [[Myrmecia] bisecta]|uniref:BZIP domain-containing protein n=1 Tax=[Myrmecia] bisecta TaxID=41462 RepID=A0AAW1QSN2_9CHLO
MRQDGMNCVSLNSTLQAQPVLSSSQLRSPQLGVDPLVALIMSDKNFSTAVSAQHLHLAAAAAVNVFKVHGAAALERSRLALSGLDTSTVPASTSGEYSEHRKGYDSRELRVNDRVFVHGSNKRTPQEVQAPRSSQALPSMLNTAPTALDMDSFPDLPDNLDGIVDGLGHGDLLLPDGSPRAGNGMGFSMQMPTAQMLQQHSYGAAHHIPDSYNGMSMAGVRQQGAVPGRAASQAGASTPKVLLKPKDVLHTVRAEMTHLEEAVPWNAVRKNWRSKRANWRRALKQAETVVELSKCLREFRTSLATDSSSVALTAKWSQSIDACIQGLGSHSVLLALWGLLTFNSSPHRALLCMDDFDSGADTGAEEGSEVTDMSDADC